MKKLLIIFFIVAMGVNAMAQVKPRKARHDKIIMLSVDTLFLQGNKPYYTLRDKKDKSYRVYIKPGNNSFGNVKTVIQ